MKRLTILSTIIFCFLSLTVLLSIAYAQPVGQTATSDCIVTQVGNGDPNQQLPAGCSSSKTSSNVVNTNPGTKNTANGSDYRQKLITDFNITMNNFDQQHLQWAYEKMQDISKTRLDSLVSGTIIYKRTDDPNWSEQTGCPGKGNTGDPQNYPADANVAMVQLSDKEIFQITLMHELGHIVQLCPPDNQSYRSAHEQILTNQQGNTPGQEYYITFYSAHAGDSVSGCPVIGVSKVNEDFAEMIAYYLSPHSKTKDVCGQGRENNPYANNKNSLHFHLAQQILGNYVDQNQYGTSYVSQ